MTKLVVGGAFGRMGQRISHLAFQDSELEVVGLLEHSKHPRLGETLYGFEVSSNPEILKQADAFIDFTLPLGTMVNLKHCVENKTGMAIGTTGFTDEEIEAIKSASKEIPIVFSSNMSVGVNILFKMISIAAEKTGRKYKMNIDETHHVHKKDAPSGTAKTMQQIAEGCAGVDVENMNSFREGEVIGDHTITFESEEDIITISHHAKNRDIFAKGALVAAKFVADKEPGLYSMHDVLGFH